jgi:hypothetical protein
MTEKNQTGIETRVAQSRIHDERPQGHSEGPQAEHESARLQLLVGELLSENQRLRFRVEQLEQQSQRLERGLKDATKWAGIVF